MTGRAWPPRQRLPDVGFGPPVGASKGVCRRGWRAWSGLVTSRWDRRPSFGRRCAARV